MLRGKEVLKAVSQNIAKLQEYIQTMYGVRAMHIDSLRTTQILEDYTIWDGMIEVFELNGHPKASVVYAWTQNTSKRGKPEKYFAVLHLNSVDSPEAAVKAAFIQERPTGEEP